MPRCDDPVRIVDYDPTWPACFEAERALLAPVFAGAECVIEHVGSTSVSGLAAKPIIDIMIGTRTLPEIEQRIREIEALGYEYVPEHEAVLPMRRYFDKPPDAVRTHHLHCIELGSVFWSDHLLFRDQLRARPGIARDYAELKRRLASEHGRDREGYTEAKGAFIEAVKAQVRRA